MDCRIMSIERRSRGAHGFTVTEMVVASGAGLLLTLVIVVLSMFTARSFVAATNYTDMSLASRLSLDDMSRAIRQCRQVVSFTNNSITLIDKNFATLRFVWNPDTRRLLKVSGTNTKEYLTDCDSLQFWVYQRTPVSNTFDCYAPASITNTKLVQVTWKCSRTIYGAKIN